MADRVYFRGGRQLAQRLAARLVGMLAGRESDDLGIARGVFLSLGFAALRSVQRNFIDKSHGGGGVDSTPWKPLSKEYVAYQRRFGYGEKTALKKAAGLSEKHRFGVGSRKAMLLPEQKKEMAKLTKQHLKRLLISMPPEDAKRVAKDRAWETMKRKVAGTEVGLKIAAHFRMTKLEVYGNRRVDILQDTRVLFNSLSPGLLESPGPNATYTPPPQTDKPRPDADGSTPSWFTGDHQIFQLQQSGVIVGTNVPYADPNNETRPFIPSEIPESWEAEWVEAGNEALAIGARMLYEAA